MLFMSPKSLLCPECGKAIDRRELRGPHWACPSCKTDVDATYSYLRCADLFAFVAVVLLGVVTHRPTSSGTWLLGIVLGGILSWFLFLFFVPPWLRKGRRQPRITLMVTYISQ